jgi:SAM-dependent methyltransferase
MNVTKILQKNLRRRLDWGRTNVNDFVKHAASETEEDMLVLDAGAGESQYKSVFSHARYYAVDFALGKPTWNYNNLDVVADLLEMPFKDNSFSVVVCTQVLEHINKPLPFLQELHRILSKDGILYLTAPQGFKEHQVPYDFFRYTSFGLRFLFDEAGFSVDYISPMGGYFYFMSDRISVMHRYLFNKKRAYVTKIIFLPLEAISKVVFSVLLPLLIGALDSFDRKHKWTNGYKCKVLKAHEESA